MIMPSIYLCQKVTKTIRPSCTHYSVLGPQRAGTNPSGSKSKLLEQRIPASFLRFEEQVKQLAFECKRSEQPSVMKEIAFQLVAWALNGMCVLSVLVYPPSVGMQFKRHHSQSKGAQSSSNLSA